MRTAALMQSHGDPCLTSYWLRNAATWRDQVDDLLVLVNRQTDVRIINWLRRETEKIDGRFYHVHGHLIHGEATRLLMGHTEADAVLLIEDDAFVRRPEAVAQAFAGIALGEYDVLATPRHGMSPELEHYAPEKWGREQPVSPEGNVGYGLWPCFVFAKTDDLRATDQMYESHFWPEGETVPGIGMVAGPGGLHTDSFTSVAFQLRAAGLHIKPGEQWKELWNRKPPLDQDPGWFHAGGLSNGDFLGYTNFGHVHDCGGNNEGLDWAHRLWWWTRAFLTRAEDCLTDSEAQRYAANLDRLITELNVGKEYTEWSNTQPWWITWDDQA